MPADRGAVAVRAGAAGAGQVRRPGAEGAQGREVHLLHRYLFGDAVSDGSATAEVTMVMRRIKCDDILPKKGDSVMLVGIGFKKILGGGKNEYSFIKIHALSIAKISH